MSYSQYFSKSSFLASQASLSVTTPPTFSGISSLVAQTNGSLLVSWNPATFAATPGSYDVYIQANTATGLFSAANMVISPISSPAYVFQLPNGTLLVNGTTYYVGVRAQDAVGNVDTNTVILSAVSSGVQPGRSLSPTDIPSIVAAVWNELQSGHTTSGTFGSYLNAIVGNLATQASVNNIPTNPLLTTDSRLNNLDAAISSRATASSVSSIASTLGTPVSTISNDIASVKSDTNQTAGRVDVTLSTRSTQTSLSSLISTVGSPVGSSVSADIASVNSAVNTTNSNVSTRASQTSVDSLTSTVGIPTTTIAGDIASVKTDTNQTAGRVDVTLSTRATQTSVNNISTTIGTPAYGSVSGDIASVKSDTSNINSNVDVAVSSRASQTSVNAIPTNPLLTTDSRLGYLANVDVLVSSRATQVSVDNVQNTVNTIQGQNVDEALILPGSISLPSTGTETYRIYFKHAAEGVPTDPGYGPYLSIYQEDGTTVIVSSTLMTNESTGLFYYDYTVSNTSYVGNIIVKVEHKNVITDPLSVTIQSTREDFVTSSVTQIATDTQTLLSRLTAPRALNLDSIDTTVSSRSSQTSIDTINTKIGTPAATVSADIAAVQSRVDSIPTNPLLTTDTRLNNLDATISSRATASALASLTSTIGTPVTTIAGDIANVHSDLSVTESTVNAINAKVDVTVSTRASQSSLSALISTIGTPVHGSISGDIAAVQGSVNAVPTATQIVNAVWDENIENHVSGTSTGRTLKDAKVFAQIGL
jgi:hypothetical protein